MCGHSTTAKPLSIRAAGLSDAGYVRERNEDGFLVDVQNGLFLVSDGVGGHARGDVATNMVIELFPQIIAKRSREMSAPSADDDPAIGEILQKSLLELSRKLYAGSKDNPAYKGMGAAVAVALLTARHAHIAHMGDSRAYLFHNGKLHQLTEDHSIVGLLVHNGELTPHEAVDHPAKGHLTRFVGMEAEVDPDVQTVETHPGDRLLLCTDGLWGMLPKDQIAEILARRNDPEITCRELVAAGKEAGGQDNLTGIIVDVYDSEVREGELLYHEYPLPRRLWRVMPMAYAKDLIEHGAFYMSNLNTYPHAEPGPRRDEKEGILEYGFNGAHFRLNGGNYVHVWCATTENDPRSLLARWTDCDAVVEIDNCTELFRRAKNACVQQGINWSEIRAGYARYDRGTSLRHWPQWGHRYVQKGLEYEDQKEYRFVIVLNPGAAYQKAVELRLGDCRDIMKIVSARNGGA